MADWRSLNVELKWEGIETRTGYWCAICALPSVVQVCGAFRINSGDLHLLAIQQCVECGLRIDPMLEEEHDEQSER
jgi:hypothetical protein